MADVGASAHTNPLSWQCLRPGYTTRGSITHSLTHNPHTAACARTCQCTRQVGWVFTVFCTYIGFALLIVGTFWSADFVPKVSAAWKALRHAGDRTSSAV